jgi:hypothetical protein
MGRMQGKSRFATALAAVFAAALLTAPSAGAAPNVTIGSPLALSFTSTAFMNVATTANLALPEPDARTTSPVFGTVVRWRVLQAAGGPLRLQVLRPNENGTFTAVATSGPQTPQSLGTEEFATNLPIQPGDRIGVVNTNSSDKLGVVTVAGASLVFWAPPLANNESRAPNPMGPFTAEIALNADVRPVSNDFSFGGVKKNKNKGTAKLTVSVPDPGTLSLSGTGLKKTTAEATQPGDVTLAVKSKGKKKTKLKSTGKVKVKPTVTFAPTGIDPGTESKKLVLKKN